MFFPKSIVVDTPHKPSNGSHIVTFVLVFAFLFSPFVTHAGVISALADKVKSLIAPVSADAAETGDGEGTSQTMSVLKPVIVDQNDATSDNETASDSDSLSTTYGSLRFSNEDVVIPSTDAISVYEVKKGDTLAKIAQLFGVSKNTIIWANNLKSETLNPGDTLVILPMSGIKHTVSKGDTIASIARKYKADAEDIASFNGLSKDADLTVGSVVLVPEGELAAVPTVKTIKKTSSGKSIVITKILDTYSNSTPPGFLIRPVVNAVKTQGIHGHNGIDLGALIGTPVMAAASGQVIVAKSSGYNGGYGEMIVISHEGNIQTVYGHLSRVNVTVGQTVSQGEVIGAVGNTGRSTGPHLHFEVRGAKNPF